jgi:hypothetical protein
MQHITATDSKKSKDVIAGKSKSKTRFVKIPADYVIDLGLLKPATSFKPNYDHPEIVSYMKSIGVNSLDDMKFSQIDKYVEILSKIEKIPIGILSEQIGKIVDGYYYYDGSGSGSSNTKMTHQPISQPVLAKSYKPFYKTDKK